MQKRNRSTASRERELALRKIEHTDPIKSRSRSFETWDPAELRRLDNVLKNSDVPLVQLQKRFRCDVGLLYARLRFLGLKVEKTRESISQERIPLCDT